MASRYCGNCGTELPQDVRFCPSCGRPVHETAQVSTPEADVDVPPPPGGAQTGTGATPGDQQGDEQGDQRRRRPVLKGCIGILVVLLLLVIIGNLVGGGGDETAGGGDDAGGGNGQQEQQAQDSGEGQQAQQEDESEQVEEPEQISLSGSGDTVTDPVQVEEGLGVINMTHQGQGNFVVEEVNGAVGELETLLVNEIGNYTGSNAANLSGGEMVLDVQADGPWEIVVEQPRTNEGSDQRTFEGDTDAVSGLIELESGNVTVDMEHQGGGNFVVELLDENGNQAGWDSLVANEIGAYSGSNSIEVPDDGTYIIDVEADGPWSIELN